jgi:arylsulfatase A-like enzyme
LVAVYGAVGFAVGFVEALIVAVRYFALDVFVLTGPHVLWMAPLASMLLFACVGSCHAVGAVVWQRSGGAIPRTFGPVALGAFALLWLAYPRLTRGAIVLLALGIATQVARSMRSSLPRLTDWALRVVAGGALATGATAVGLAVAVGARESWLASRLSEAESGSPNIVLIVLDTVRAASLGLYGHERPTTPRLEELAERSVVFTQAFSTAPWTLPAHASLFTGRDPHELSANWTRPLDHRWPVLAEVLGRHGYRTAGFSGNLRYVARDSGLDRGFQHFEDYELTVAEFMIASSLGRFVIHNPAVRRAFSYHDLPARRTAEEIGPAALSWVAGRGERPFFVFLNLYDAHDPVLPPPAYAQAFGVGPRDLERHRITDARSVLRSENLSLSPAEVDAEVRAYDAAISYLDDQVAAFLGGLEALGELDDAIVIITSDHGEMFGEHGFFAHGHSLFTELVRVPLVVVAPGRLDAAERVDFVSTRDIGPTVLQLAGITEQLGSGGSLLEPGGAEVPLAVVEPAAGQDPRYPSSTGTMFALMREPHQYVWRDDGSEWLYDLISDPSQQADLLGRPGVDDVVASLRGDLAARRATTPP